MKSKILTKTRIEWWLLALVILLAAFLRFYHLSGLNHFTYDQARDVLYIKRIIVDHKLRLIGTQSSIPGLYTPPFYYYLMAPFLWLFRLDPVGLDYATAFFGVLTIVILYWLLRALTDNKIISFLVASLYAFQPTIIHQSRFAWNPNTMPFFTLLALFFLTKILEGEKKVFPYLILFFSLGMAINLHYAGLIFSLAFFLLFLFFLKRLDKKGLFWGGLGFLFTLTPLLLFDLRHNLTNFRGVINYFFHSFEDKNPPLPFFTGLIEKYRSLMALIFPAGINPLVINLGIILLTLLFFRAIKEKKRKAFKLFFFVFLTSLVLASFYKRGFFFFYLTFLYPLPFLLLGMTLSGLARNKRLKSLIIPLLFILVLSQALTSWREIRNIQGELKGRLMKTSQFLAEKVTPPFNLVAINREAERFGSNAVDYRYFLETFSGKRSLGWDPIDYQQATHLYLISEVGEVEVEGLNIWELETFGSRKVQETWKVADTIIYHLLK